jgi:hypothetical protein
MSLPAPLAAIHKDSTIRANGIKMDLEKNAMPAS